MASNLHPLFNEILVAHGMPNQEPAADKYGNPVDGSSLPFCCFPDCGCDGARLCMAESGPNFSAECLNLERFRSRQAAVLIETWRQHYNTQRPHSTLGHLIPDEFRSKFETIPTTTAGEALLQ